MRYDNLRAPISKHHSTGNTEGKKHVAALKKKKYWSAFDRTKSILIIWQVGGHKCKQLSIINTQNSLTVSQQQTQ